MVVNGLLSLDPSAKLITDLTFASPGATPENVTLALDSVTAVYKHTRREREHKNCKNSLSDYIIIILIII